MRHLGARRQGRDRVGHADAEIFVAMDFNGLLEARLSFAITTLSACGVTPPNESATVRASMWPSVDTFSIRSM
jgi:hypothetical protein